MKQREFGYKFVWPAPLRPDPSPQQEHQVGGTEQAPTPQPRSLTGAPGGQHEASPCAPTPLRPCLNQASQSSLVSKC